jgi:superfamily II DNA or RNA helicase
MSEIKLRDYQRDGANELYVKLKTNDSVLFQLATGGGKTFVFSFFVRHWLTKNDGNVLILVHRKELLEQTINSLAKLGVTAEGITKDNKKPKFKDRVYVSMVQTLSRRLKKDDNYVPNVKLLIIDECHRNDFKTVFPFYENAKKIGFSATPISANKKHPLKDFYKEIVCAAGIDKLLEDGSLTNCKSYALNIGIDNKKFKKNNQGEYTTRSMGSQFKLPKMVKKTVESYEKKCLGKKTLIFNTSIDHCLEVCNQFVMSNYNAQYLDSTFSQEERDKVLDWFKHTPGAILCNVDILTTGFDEPSIEAIIVNRSTTSESLWLQMTGRGGRLFDGKEYFTIVDLGDNFRRLSKWEDNRDWRDKFFNPKELGVSPMNDCDECGYINEASAKFCVECGSELTKGTSDGGRGLSNRASISVEKVGLIQISDSKKVTEDYADDLLNRLFVYTEYGYKPHRLVHEIQADLISEKLKYYRVKRFTQNKDEILKELSSEFRKQYKVLYDYDRSTFKDFNNLSYWNKQLENKLNKKYSVS